MILIAKKYASPAFAAVLLALILTGCKQSAGGGTEGASSSKSGGGDAKKQAASGKSVSGSAGSTADTEGKPDRSSEGGAQPNDVVRISAEDQRRGGVQTDYVLVQRVPRSLSVAGQVAMDELHTSHVGTIADGRITAVNVLPGAMVHRGQVLGSLHSHSVHETVGALVQAFAAVDRQHGAVTFARQARDRYNHLYSIQAASLEESQRANQDLLQAEQMLVDAQANVRMEREHLSELLQVSPESLTPDHLYDRELIPIRAPIDGVIVARNITVGQVVELGFNAFDITNLATVWVTAAVNQQDLALIHTGALTEILDSASPDVVSAGRVTMLGNTLDTDTRTAPVRIVVPNPGTRLRPGMFVSAQIAEPSTRESVFIPEDALQDINGLQVVFVSSDGQSFQARTVNLGTRSQRKVEVVSGLRPGDRIVVNGAFMVKAEMLKGTMGGG
jgi:cobalt-zinc-cadmium efflux system membrane fusion protein